MTRKHIYAEGPGLRPNSMGIWRNEAGFLLYEDAEIEPSTVWLHGEPTDLSLIHISEPTRPY